MTFSLMPYDTLCKHTELSLWLMSFVSSLPVEKLTPHLLLNIYIKKKNNTKLSICKLHIAIFEWHIDCHWQCETHQQFSPLTKAFDEIDDKQLLKIAWLVCWKGLYPVYVTLQKYNIYKLMLFHHNFFPFAMGSL